MRDHAASLDSVRREMAGSKQQFTELESRLERAIREGLTVRAREGHVEIVKDLETCLGGLREEFGSSLKKLSAELRSETRALLKSEQNAIAALDEQLWLTDQRLGQRVDELVKIHAARQPERSPRLVTQQARAAERSIERSEREVQHVRGEGLWSAIKESGRAPLGTPRGGSPGDGSSHGAPASPRGGSPPGVPRVIVTEPVAYDRGSGGPSAFANSSRPSSHGPGRSADTALPLSNAEQLALLRDARARRGFGGGILGESIRGGFDSSRTDAVVYDGGPMVEAA